MRGGKNVSTLKFLHAQHFFNDDQFKSSLKGFAIPRSGIAKDLFWGDTLFSGLWNGHKKLLVELQARFQTVSQLEERGYRFGIGIKSNDATNVGLQAISVQDV